MNKGKQLLTDIKFTESYAKTLSSGFKETWKESTSDVMRMHRNRFEHISDMLPILDFIEGAYTDKRILASQRSLQYREPQILKHNARIMNCASTYIDRPEVFKQVMYILLCGCGVGYSVEGRFIDKLPTIKNRLDETITFQIEDSIEGWALALDALVMSYFNGTEQIRFDGSLIREEGSYISGGFAAPGYEPLRKSLELIENLINDRLTSGKTRLTSLDCHEILCIASDAVLSAGVRRSAIICIFDRDDELMLNCKTGDWFYKKPWLARANNSVKLLKGTFTKEEFESYKETIKQFGEPGVVLVDDIDFCTNPCCEIGFIPINPKNGNSCISFCNLNEINGAMCNTPEDFFLACKAAAALGTLQASYTDMHFLGQDTIDLIELEALLGVSITGFMDNPEILLNPEILREGARIVVETNKEVARLIGINQSARTTTVKPSGNASVLLQTASGIHPAHSRRYFRIMQLNKNTEIARKLESDAPYLLEDSVWSNNKTDHAVYIPIIENDNVITKEQLSDVDFLRNIDTVFNNWIIPGTNKELGYSSRVTHNVSNTISVQDWDRTFDYIYNNYSSFCGLSFMSEMGDKVYKQAPFTKVMEFQELISTFGEAILFASGLIVDSLHAFNNDLWDACEAATDKNFILSGDRYSTMLKKDVVRRIKKFSKNYFKGNIVKTIDCLKNIHIYHKFNNITREMKDIDFSTMTFSTDKLVNAADYAAVACSGGSCEIVKI